MNVQGLRFVADVLERIECIDEICCDLTRSGDFDVQIPKIPVEWCGELTGFIYCIDAGIWNFRTATAAEIQDSYDAKELSK